MKLFYVPGTCSLSPHIVAREAGLPVDLELVDRQSKQTSAGRDYKALNPKGYVPALQLDDGQILTEGTVIVQYLADQKPATKLAPPAGTMERYRLMEWLNFIATELHKGVSPLFNPKLPDELRKTTLERLNDRLGQVERRLAEKPYLMGDAFSVADAYLFVVLFWCKKRLGVPMGPFPAIERQYGKLAERPAVAAALKEEGLVA